MAYAVLQGNSGIYKNKGTFIWNFVLNSGGLGKFGGVVIFAEVRSTKQQTCRSKVDNTCDGRPLVYHVIVKLCLYTAPFRRANHSAMLLYCTEFVV